MERAVIIDEENPGRLKLSEGAYDRRVALGQVSQHLAGQTAARSVVPMKARTSA